MDMNEAGAIIASKMRQNGPIGKMARELLKEFDKMEDYQVQLGIMEIGNPSVRREGYAQAYELRGLGRYDLTRGYLVSDRVGTDFVTNERIYRIRIIEL